MAVVKKPKFQGGAFVVIALSDAGVKALRKPVRGRGGFQSALRFVRSKTRYGVVTLSGREAARLIRLATRYQQGGFQERITEIIANLFVLRNALR